MPPRRSARKQNSPHQYEEKAFGDDNPSVKRKIWIEVAWASEDEESSEDEDWTSGKSTKRKVEQIDW